MCRSVKYLVRIGTVLANQITALLTVHPGTDFMGGIGVQGGRKEEKERKKARKILDSLQK